MVKVGLFFARIALPAILAFAVMTVAEHLAGTSPVRSAVRPTGVVWAGRTFATRADLARWLQAHGTSYEQWASAHPVLAAAESAPKKEGALAAPAKGSQARGQDPTHLFALGVAGGVALILCLVLLYQRRLYDFRGSLQRSAPTRIKPPQAIPAGAGASVPRDAAVSLRTRVLNPTVGAVRAAASGAGPALHAFAQSRGQPRRLLYRFRREHPDVTWFVGACTFAVAVGIAIPFIVR